MKKTHLLTILCISVIAIFGCVFFGCEWPGNNVVSSLEFQQEKFFMYGNEYDRCIDSEEEYKMFIWHNILYQESDVHFYKNFTSIRSIEDLTKSAINSYPEYSGVNVKTAYTSNVSGNEYIAMSGVTYYLDKDRIEDDPITTRVGNTTYTYEDYAITSKHLGVEKVEVTLNGQDDAFIAETPETLNERHFPIDDKDGNVVYNSEQLFMTVVYGRKPIFNDTTSVAYQIYVNAREILSKINSDDMSDYQKVKNIFDYIIGHNTYNNVIISYMSLTSDYTQSTYGNYSDFYLEGILYDLDRQVSVCDGISKAFALMCNIEGIDAIKINGTVGSEGGYGDHAWNKVKIGDNWYTVDITWSDFTFTDNDTLTYEAATHRYFLVSDETLAAKSPRTEEWPTNTPTTIDYDFYSIDGLEYEAESQSFEVNSKAEVDKLIAIAYALDKDGVEIMFSDEYYDLIDGMEGNLDGGWIEYDDQKITVEYAYSLSNGYYASFEYNDNIYQISQESTADTITYTLYRIVVRSSAFGPMTSAEKVCVLDGRAFTIDETSFTYVPKQEYGEAVYYRANVLGNNTADNQKRLSFVCYDKYLIVWIGKYPVID